MTSERRLAKLETSLSPTQLVLRWLAEAHAYGSLEAYVGSLLDVPADQQPIDRLCREASDGARARLRGKPAEQVRKAVNSALRETVFRFELELRIYVTTRELLDREALIDAALSAHVSLATSEEAADTDHLARLRDLLVCRVGELHAAEEARAIAERRYLDGHGALFPDVATAWQEQARAQRGSLRWQFAWPSSMACRLHWLPTLMRPQCGRPSLSRIWSRDGRVASELTAFRSSTVVWPSRPPMTENFSLSLAYWVTTLAAETGSGP